MKKHNVAISYAFSNEKGPNGSVDKDFLCGYLDDISHALQGYDTIGSVFHSLIPSFDNKIEQEVWNNDDVPSEQKYDLSLGKCIDAFESNQTEAIFFVLKYPGRASRESGVNPVPSTGMTKELKYAHQKGLQKIVLLQRGLEQFDFVEKFTKEALVIKFDTLVSMQEIIQENVQLKRLLRNL